MNTAESDAQSSITGSTFAILGGILGVLFSVVLTFSYPLAAPLVALVSVVCSVFGYRRSKNVVWLILAIIGTLSFVGALAIDLGLLVADSTTTTTDGPIPTNR
ncbi:hypothetical protein [Actinokineospora pegani]|uniref:hypothetical protein n=1 Tax=Actinokineospora pegani TaxID=2654637 RepID=UPI0012EA0AFE|nr:hypothetical protein [Actinokineospora pegani]